MRDALRMQERADIVVGIPSFRNAATIGHVTEAAAEGLRRNFPNMRAVIVNADGGSEDGTRDRVRASADGVPIVTGRYQGRSGKGSAFRAIFEAVTLLGARACAVVDSDLRSITPEWIARLGGPIVRGEADYVTPLYARHKNDGTITNTIAYPLTRALYGARVRQPIIGEIVPVEPEAVKASGRVLIEKFRAGAADQDQAWTAILSADTREVARKAAEAGNASAIGGRFWAKAVYEIVAAAKTREDTETLARALLPLHFGRVAALIGEMQGLDQAGAERVVEQQALAFEQTKPYLLERWA